MSTAGKDKPTPKPESPTGPPPRVPDPGVAIKGA